MTWFFLAVLAVTAATAFRRGADLVSPSRIYICVYSALLALYHLSLSRLQTPWSLSSILLFYGASGLFLLAGLWMCLTVRIRFPAWRFDFGAVRASLSLDAGRTDWAWFWRVFILCTLGYLASFGVSYLVVGGVPMFMEDPDDARIRFFTATQLTNYGIFLGPVSVMLGTEFLLFANPPPGRRRLAIAILGLVVGLYLTMVTRYDIFRVLIFCVVFYHYGRRSLRPVHLMAGLGLASAVFLIGFLVRVNTDTIATFNEMIKVKMPPHLAWASNIYAYLANDFWNFDFAIRKYLDGEGYYPLQYGVSMFRALLWNLRLEPGLIEAYRMDTIFNESATKVGGLNTVIYVWHLYKDFGFLGAQLVTLLGGLLIWRFYLNTMMGPTLFRISVWGILAGAVALSYHNPLWELWFVYLNLLILAVAHRRLRVL